MDSLPAHHVGIAVEDVETVAAFYRETFGFETAGSFTVAGDAFATGIGVDAATGRFVRLSMDGVLLELVEYEPAGTALDRGSVRDPGSVHVAVSCGDVEAFYDDLGPDVETISEPVTTESGTTILFVRDPEGNLVEVVSTAAGGDAD